MTEHRPTPASATPPTAAGRLQLAPVIVALAVFFVASMGLLVWSHHRWDTLLRGSVVPLDRLAEVRRHALAAELFAERLIAGDRSVSASLVHAELDRSRIANTELLFGNGSLAGMYADTASDPALQVAAEAQMRALDTFRTAVAARLERPGGGAGAEMRAACRLLDTAANHVESVLVRDLARRRAEQHRIDALNVALVGALTLLLYMLLRRTDVRSNAAFKALADSESRLRAFSSGVPGVSFLLDADGRYLEVFGSELALLAAPREAVLGRTLHEVFPKDVADGFAGVIRAALDRRTTQIHEYRMVLAGGARWFEARVAPVGDTDRVVWISWDITARKDAEARLSDLTRLYGFLSQVNQSIVFANDRGTLFRRICAAAVAQGSFRAAWVDWLSDDRKQLVCVARAGMPLREEGAVTELPDESSWDTHPEAAALNHDRIGQVGDIATLRGSLEWRAAAIGAGLVGLAVIPVRRDGQPVAVLTLLAERVDPHDVDERTLLEEVGTDMSFAITQFAREEERRSAEQRVRLHAAALESTRDGVMVTDLETRIVSINRAFTEITGYTEDDVLGLTPSILRSGRHGPEFYGEIWNTLSRIGHWQGEIWNRRKNGEPYSQWMSISTVRDRDGHPTHYVSVLTDITKLKQTEERLHQLAHYDPLTSLPNRLLIASRLDHALAAAKRSGRRVAVLFIDLDNFKTVNDGLGHAVGDELLTAVAQRLSGRLRGSDTLGRLGGDEFLLVLEELVEPQEAAVVATHLLESLGQPFVLTGGHEIYIQASAGISLYPDDSDTAAGLISDADAAMYQAKRSGRSTYRFYTEALTAAANSRLMMETRLRRAFEQDEFELHYQPVVRVSDSRVIGFEALVRLCPPGMDPMSPASFIPLLEETGLIVTLGEWVLRKACLQGRAWLDAGILPGIIAVNLSPSEIRRGGVDERLRRVLEETGFPPQHLELEMTESGLMEQGEHAEAFLRSLKALGVRLSIDDFGTGYSSLAYLKRFPVDKLKIDRSFIRDIPDDRNGMQLTSTIIALARGLELNVVAEGVETQAQFDFLQAHACDAYQGWLFSPAVPASVAEAQFLRADHTV